MASKLITIVGITGNQGASVADAFINEPGWKIRGISRDPGRESSKVWSNKGIEMVAADLDDAAALKKAFKGSNVIFGVTDFWQQVRVPANHQKAKESGETINVIAAEAESQQGKNIVDAAHATADTLDMLVLSVLGDSKKFSHGKITWNYHFDAKWRVVEYLEKTYPDLYKKSSFFQPAFFVTNLETMIKPRQLDDGSYVFSLPLDGNKQVPMYHARQDSGPLVKALVKSAPGKNLMGYSGTITFDEISQMFSQYSGKNVKYDRCTVDVMDQMVPGGVGRELGEMMEYISNPGYYGGEEAVKELHLIAPKELAGDIPLTDVKEFLKTTLLPRQTL